ncbi:MAG TPA: GspE/PulE family protein [Candidatus Paceibacterota bacterium]|jgi:type IV pilus assembly protein PilB|nr:GspE/PulE family protein [Candidatus Paceibacterota bacterium]
MADSASLKIEIEKNLAQPVERISIVKLVDLLVEYAYSLRASDVHIQPEEKLVRVRFRIDGVLRDIFDKIGIHRDIHNEVVSRIKVLAGLRTDEHLAPQDGRFKVNVKDVGDVNVRVSIIPTYHGENSILRILAETQEYTLDKLSFAPDDLAKVRRAISKPYGMILANGPTGSGKTTTLYTILKQLNNADISIITIEDPIEYALDGTTQIQVETDTGLTFAGGLRSILRQDPNIIMVGEIRDEETAAIAVNAALTGHLVLSTLHTNDAATTFPRLLDMGVPSFLVASTVNLVIGQRLVRKLCQKCKVERKLHAEEFHSLKEIVPELEQSMHFYAAKGCSECNDTGYEGRIVVREVIEVRDKIRALISAKANAQEIKDVAVAEGMRTIMQDAMTRASEGLTTIEEVLRVVHE